jgi:hypothetical protein
MNSTLFIFFIILVSILLLSKYFFTDIWLYFVNIKLYRDQIFLSKYLLNNNLLASGGLTNNKIAIITYDDRKNMEYIDLHNKNIDKYCKKWNYEYKFYDKCTHNVYWCKIYMVLDLLKSGKYDYVMWLDSDTIIKNYEISIDSIVNKYSSDIFMSENNNLLEPGGLCSGVFIIKNSPIGISFLEDCIKLNTDTCKTPDNKLKGFWAGICYEQGAMNRVILDKYYKYTTNLPKQYIYNNYLKSNMDTCNKDTFIIHAYGTPDTLRTKCFNKFI